MTAIQKYLGQVSMWTPTSDIVEKIRAIGKDHFYARLTDIANKLAAAALEVKVQAMREASECGQRDHVEETYGRNRLINFPTEQPWLPAVEFDLTFDPLFPITLNYAVEEKGAGPVALHWIVARKATGQLSDEDFEFLQLAAYRAIVMGALGDLRKAQKTLAAAKVNPDDPQLF